MDNRGNDNSTAVTKISADKKARSQPMMSFTAVTSHQAMAAAFVNELLRSAQQLIPDRELTAEDMLSILQRALYDDKDRSVTMVSGRHLRSRISDQVSRAKRYNEPFSLVALKLPEAVDTEDYDAVVDTLRERMRQTDLIFLFKHRIVLLLPHTEKEACQVLQDRIQQLLKGCLHNMPPVETNCLTFPDSELHKGMEVLDWAENQLR